MTTAASDTTAQNHRARRERDALLQLARDMAGSSPSAKGVLLHLAQTAQSFTQSEGACVLELRPELFRVAAPTGIVRPYDEQSFSIMPPPSLFREALSTRQVVVTNDGANDPRVDSRFRDSLRVRHVAVAPIVVSDRVDGLLVVINAADPLGYSDDDAAFMQCLADFSAVALRDAALVARAESAAADAERQARETAMAARRSAVLARTAEALASAGSTDAVYAQIGEIVRELLGAGGFSIFDVNVEAREAQLAFQTGVGSVDSGEAGKHFWATRMADVVLTGTPTFVDNMRAGSNTELRLTEPLRAAGIAALALLPLRISGRICGLMSIRCTAEREPDPTEHAFLESFASQVGLALRNARHVNDLSERARRLATLAHAQQRLAGTLQASQLPAAILDAIEMIVPATSYELLESDAAGNWSLVLERRQPEDGVCTGVLTIPMHTESRPSRMIRLHTRDTAGFDTQDADLVNILARHAMQAYETVHLLEAESAERQRAEAAADIARSTLSSGSVESASLSILEILDRVVPTSGKAIGVARARDGRIEYSAAIGSLAGMLGHRPAGPFGIPGLSPDGRAVEIANLHDEAPESVRPVVPAERALVLPLLARDRSLGALILTAPTDAPWRAAERATIEHLSISVALAVDAVLLDEEERQARAREHTLATALTTLDHPVFILEHDIIRYANPASAREYGRPVNELLGRPFADLVASVTPSRHRLGLSGREGVPMDDAWLPAEHRHRRSDGTEFVAAVTVSELRTEAGVEHGTVVSVRDVTMDRAVAEQLRHSEKMVALGELVAGVAHEINNPLTGISAFAELLLEDRLGDEQRESVQLIKRESDRATQVIRDLLLFARKSDAPVGPVDVNALIEQTLRLRAYVLRSSEIEVALDLDSAGPAVQGDAQRLQQVVLNLITNAEHAMEGCARRLLTLSTHQHEGRVVIRVSDTGRGMSAAVQRRLFEPFFTTKPPGVGTGLGLSVSYGIAQAHNGTLEVHSTVGVGTSFVLELPALSAAVEQVGAQRNGSLA